MSPRQRRRGLAVVWLALAALVVGIAATEYADRRRALPGAAGETDTSALVPVSVDQLGAIEVAERGRLHRFERDATGVWFYHGVHTSAAAAHTHAVDPALAARIEQTVAAFGRTRIERRFAPDRETATYGVTAPEIVILLYRPQQPQPLVQYAVGAIAPDTVSRYVMPVGSPEIVTIPNYQIENVRALIQLAGEPSGQGTAGAR